MKKIIYASMLLCTLCLSLVLAGCDNKSNDDIEEIDIDIDIDAELEAMDRGIPNPTLDDLSDITKGMYLYFISENTCKNYNDGAAILSGDESKTEEEIGTIIYVKVDEKVIGAIILNDSVKQEAKQGIANLNKLGINTVMFTGDNLEVAKKVAKEIGIEEIKAEMLPIEKYNELEKILNNKETGTVAFVGDGINDAPVLALADIGISMGEIGSGSAIEASDIVIMTDNLEKIVETIDISKMTDKIIKQNLVFALVTKFLVLILSALGLAQMWMAVFADVGVTLLTILNTIRILRK